MVKEQKAKQHAIPTNEDTRESRVFIIRVAIIAS